MFVHSIKLPLVAEKQEFVMPQLASESELWQNAGCLMHRINWPLNTACFVIACSKLLIWLF